MRKHPLTALSLSFLLLALPACSAHQARQAIAQRQDEYRLNAEAWRTARLRLKAMCPMPTHGVKAVEEALYETYRGADIKIDSGVPIMDQAGKDIREGKLNIDVFRRNLESRGSIGGDRSCGLRLIKTTNAPTSDDWAGDWLPSYEIIISVHEEELRKRVLPKLYEEYMLGQARYLALKADAREITQVQLRRALDEGWAWMVQKMREEHVLLQQNLQVAEYNDAVTLRTVGEIAVGLAAVTTAVLLASAAEANARAAYAYAYRASAPTSCYAYPSGGGNYYVRCW